MGKSFNDDIFNNNFNLDSINGLNISQEAINENKKAIDLESLAKAKEQYKAYQEQQEKPILTDNTEAIIQAKEIVEQQTTNNNIIYTKKTMIFNQEYLDIIDGLAINNNMQIKDVLNQLLGRAISELDSTIRDKALKTGKKPRNNNKSDKSIF